MPASKQKQIFLADDHPMMRAGLADLINQQGDLHVCDEAESAAETWKKLRPPLPDLLIADLTMGPGSGIEFIKSIRAIHSRLPILVYTMHDESLYGDRVLGAGAIGYVSKDKGGEHLLAAIRQVLTGHVVIGAETANRIVQRAVSHRAPPTNGRGMALTDREFEVLRLMGEGKNAHLIAKHLSISRKTVDAHRSHLKEKLGLKDMTALVHFAAHWSKENDPLA